MGKALGKGGEDLIFPSSAAISERIEGIEGVLDARSARKCNS